jgi:hypothetical protein
LRTTRPGRPSTPTLRAVFFDKPPKSTSREKSGETEVSAFVSSRCALLSAAVGKQVFRWPDLEYTTHVVLTNDFGRAADDVARDYDGHAEVETIIAELKGALGIGKVPSQVFDATTPRFCSSSSRTIFFAATRATSKPRERGVCPGVRLF